MAQPSAVADSRVFNEHSSRISKSKRPDSGIHNSTELNGEHEKPDHHHHRQNEEAKHSNEEFVDSGQESDQVDSSVNSSGKKKGFLKNFKKIFKKKKSSKPEKPEKSKSKAKKLDDQTKASSEPDILAETSSSNNHQFEQTNTEASFSPKKKKPPRTFSTKVAVNDDTQHESEDESNIEKKSSLKDGAQQYIRSSLRKLKGKRPKTDSEAPAEEERSTPSPVEDSNMNLDDEFFSKTLAEEKPSVVTKAGSLKLTDIKTTTPKIQSDAAKDRIRIAPQNRRKPSRYRGAGGGGSPSKPARTSSIHSFNNDSGLGKIEEDKDNFTSINRNSSSIGQRTSSYSRQESIGSNQDSRESLSDSRKMSDPSTTRILKQHSFTTTDDTEEPRKSRTIPQRSLSSNSRENVNRPKPPAKPPRSTHTSTNSLHKEDVAPSRGFSLSALNNDFFYTKENETNTEKRDSYGAAFGLSSSMNNQNTPLNEIDQNVPTRTRHYSKDSSFSDDGNPTSSRERIMRSKEDVSRRSKEDVNNRSIEDILRKSKEDLSSRSSGENVSRRSIHEILGRSKEDISRKSSEDISKRSKEDISRKIKEDVSRSSKEYTRTKDVDVSNGVELTNGGQELIFPKTEDKYGMMAFALTSPSPAVQPEEAPVFSRSKSFSGKSHKQTDSNEHMNEFRERSQTSGAKSHGQLNEVGRALSPPPVKQKPFASPRKLRRPTSPERRNDDVESKTTPEFNRISLKKVPKLEDYSFPPSVDQTPQSEFNTNTTSIENHDSPNKQFNTTTVTVETKEMPSVKPFKMPDLRSTDMYHHSATKKPLELEANTPTDNSDISETKVENKRSEFLLKRHSLKKIEPPSDLLDKTQDSFSTPPVLQTTTSYTTPELKRTSWKNVEEKSPNVDAEQTPQGFKRNSLKKIDRSSFEVHEGEQYVLPTEEKTKVTSEPLNDEKTAPNSGREEIYLPRPLIKGRPTVHAKSSFKFQSNDVLPRSKSLSSAEAKKLRNSPTEESEENKAGEEPEWFKLARRKQKNEGNHGNVGDEPVKKEQKIEDKPSLPQTKPKVSPRPVVSPKPIVSPRPKISVAPPPTRTSRSFNANTDVTKNECIVCNKTAYTFEKLDVNGHILHKNCAKCEQCSRKLNVGDIFIKSEKVYCSQHK